MVFREDIRRPPSLCGLLVSVALLAPGRGLSQTAGACLSECQGPICSDFGNKTDMCLELRAKCGARCSGRRWWGAIAYSAKDKHWGYSTDFNDLNDAKKAAMTKCTQHGGAGCKLWIWYENECGALATDGSIVTWGTAPIREYAQRRAIQECRKAGGKNCTIAVWACSKM